MKIDLLNSKTLLKLVTKTFKKMKIFTLEIVENQLKWRVFITPTKSARWQSSKGQFCASSRPGDRPANDHIYDRLATGRPAGQPKTGNREQNSLPVDRALDRGHF